MATTTQTNIVGFADQVAPYAEAVLGGAARQVEQPYESYANWARKRGLSGDQVQAFTDLQKQSFKGAEGLTQDPYSQAAAQGIQGSDGAQYGEHGQLIVQRLGARAACSDQRIALSHR